MTPPCPSTRGSLHIRRSLGVLVASALFITCTSTSRRGTGQSDGGAASMLDSGLVGVSGNSAGGNGSTGGNNGSAEGGITPDDLDAGDVDGGLGGSASVPWPGTIVESLAEQTGVTAVVSNPNVMVFVAYSSPTRQVRVFTLHLADYSWEASTPEILPVGVSGPDMFDGAVVFGGEELTRVDVYSPDGMRAWTWSDTEEELAGYYAEEMIVIGDRFYAKLVNEEAANELGIWENVGGEVTLRRVPLPVADNSTFTPRGTVVSVIGSDLVESGEDGTVLSCPVGFTMINLGHKVMGDTTLINTSDGIAAFGATCESIEVFVPADDPGYGNVISAGPELFTTGDAFARHVTMWTQDGTRVGDGWGVDVLDGGPPQPENYYQPAPPFRSGAGHALLFGEFSRREGGIVQAWPRVLGFAADNTPLSRQDFLSDPPFGSTTVHVIAAQPEGDGVILVTSSENQSPCNTGCCLTNDPLCNRVPTSSDRKLIVSRFSAADDSFAYDPGSPPQGGSGGAGGGSGGGECSEPYSETRLANDVQLNSYCQAAYAYWCDDYQPGVMSSCAILTELEFASSCKYCN